MNDDWKDSYQEYKWEREAEKKAHQEWLDAGAIPRREKDNNVAIRRRPKPLLRIVKND